MHNKFYAFLIHIIGIHHVPNTGFNIKYYYHINTIQNISFYKYLIALLVIGNILRFMGLLFDQNDNENMNMTFLF